MNSVQSLTKSLQMCGALNAAEVRQDDACQAAQQAGLLAAVVNCDRARSRSAIFRAVVKAVDFPEFFGNDLDAFYDCLCDTVLDQKTGLLLWFHRLHSGDPVLQADAAHIQQSCENVVEFAKNNNRLFVYALDHAGCHPDPEPGVAPTPYTGAA